MAKFSDEEIQLAKKVQNEYGVPASVTLAQYGLESGYGKSTVGKNNYFNIKGNGNGGYRDYGSKEESFMDYGALLSTDRYTTKTSGAQTVREYVQGLKDAGYAEDPQYVAKVMAIINGNDLTRYDTGEYGTGDSSGSTTDLKWWGDIVIVIFCVIVVIGGVIFLAMAVTNPVQSISTKIKKAVQ